MFLPVKEPAKEGFFTRSLTFLESLYLLHLKYQTYGFKNLFAKFAFGKKTNTFSKIFLIQNNYYANFLN